jgi:two-component sensor histidine kinase
MTLHIRTTAMAETTASLHLVDEINHRVANEFAEAISGLALAARGAAGEAQAALRRAADRLRAHAEAHRALMAPWEARVNLADYLGLVCGSLTNASLAERCVRLSLHIDDIWMASDRAWRFGLALSELVRNAARHGLGGRAGVITVGVLQSGGQVVGLVCVDGHGDAELRTGRGMSVVRALVAELGGSVEWLPGERGCVTRLRLPADI